MIWVHEDQESCQQPVTIEPDWTTVALALATTFIGTIANDEASYQELMLVVDSHRKMFKLNENDDLKNLFYADCLYIYFHIY